MNYDPTFDLRQFAEKISETAEKDMAETFARLDARSRDQYLSQVRACSRSGLLSHRKTSVIWGTERRLSAIHKAMTDAGR